MALAAGVWDLFIVGDGSFSGRDLIWATLYENIAGFFCKISLY